MSSKYNQLCLIVALGTLSCLIFLIAVRSKVLGNKIALTEWDINTVTLTDYSVELPVDLKGYKHWFNHVFHGPGGDYSKNISPGMSLKRHIIRKVEKQLTAELKAQQERQARNDHNTRMNMNLLSKSIVSTGLEKIKVADLTFSRYNRILINLLKKRGTAIAEQNFKHMHALEDELNLLVKKNYDKFITPHTAIITFEEEEGPKLALNNNDSPSRPQILGSTLKFYKAHPPTDIIWEHRVKKNFWKKHSLAVLALLLLLLGSFIVVYQISSWEQAISDMFPAVDCNFIREMYGNKLRRFALEDFDRIDNEDAK